MCRFLAGIVALSVAIVWLMGQASAHPATDFDTWASDPDDIYWEPGYGIRGIEGDVSALTTYNGLLIAGGHFGIAGDAIVHNIAAWNGSSWSPLGEGIDGSVYALVAYGDVLIAGGEFEIAGDVPASNIAVWDGVSWSPLGSGVDDRVNTLVVWDNQVFAGGVFSTAGGISANGVAGWDGAHWSGLGSGLGSGLTVGVRSLTVYNDQLVAGGVFRINGEWTWVALWTGAAWLDMGLVVEGGDAGCTALAVYDGHLIASFVHSSGDMSWVYRWNGSAWSEIYGNMGHVYSLVVYDGRLIVSSPQTVTYGGILRAWTNAWDGSSWSNIASDFGAYVFTVHDGMLIAGGDFYLAPGGVLARRIASWNGSTWFPLGSGSTPYVAAFAVYNDQLIVGGSFYSIGDCDATRIAAWDGSVWSPLGSGLSYSSLKRPYLGVTALADYGDQLIATGTFDGAGGAPVNNIATWDGEEWSPLGSGFSYSNPDDPNPHPYYCLAVYHDELIAGGDLLMQVGGDHWYGVAAWDGASWRDIGFDEFMPRINAMTVYNGRLIVAGFFGRAGGVTARHIAAWDGSAWSPLGLGLGSYVYGLAEYDGRLVACGSFDTAGEVTVPGIAAWDGMAWSTLGTMDPCSSYHCSFQSGCLTVFKDRLIAGGKFTELNSVPVNRIAAWDGSTWSPLGSGLSNSAVALFSLNDQLWVGGPFTTAGDKVSAYLATWNPPPWSLSFVRTEHTDGDTITVVPGCDVCAAVKLSKKLAGIVVDFAVDGANEVTKSGMTDANGRASVCYPVSGVGADRIIATATLDGPTGPYTVSDTLVLHLSPAELNLSLAGHADGDSVVAMPGDEICARVELNIDAAGVEVTYEVPGVVEGTDVTDDNGVVSFCYPVSGAGVDLIVATSVFEFATGTHTASDTVTLNLLPPELELTAIGYTDGDSVVVTPGDEVCVWAELNTDVAGVEVNYEVPGVTEGSGVTDDEGVVSFCYPVSGVGVDSIIVTSTFVFPAETHTAADTVALCLLPPSITLTVAGYADGDTVAVLPGDSICGDAAFDVGISWPVDLAIRGANPATASGNTDGGVWHWCNDLFQTGVDTIYISASFDFPSGSVTQSDTLVLSTRIIPDFVTSFVANETREGVQLAWGTIPADYIKGFNIYRSAGQAQPEELVNTEGLLASDVYEYQDESVWGGNTFTYTLGVVLTNDAEMCEWTATINTKVYPLALLQNYPNPFNPSTTIPFTLPERTNVVLSIYDVQGQLINTLINGIVDDGYQEFQWNGNDMAGTRVGSGVYFCRLTARDRTLTRKIVVVR